MRDNRARLVPIKVGRDNGLRIAVREGLKETDKVIVYPPSGLSDGAEVSPTEAEQSEKEPSGH